MISLKFKNQTVKDQFEYLPSSEIRFFVRDNGPGVPAEHRKSIFDKYFQLDKKSEGRVHTTGLGLTFCKLAVDAHRGKVWVESESQKGSRFCFTLPTEKTTLK